MKSENTASGTVARPKSIAALVRSLLVRDFEDPSGELIFMGLCVALMLLANLLDSWNIFDLPTAAFLCALATAGLVLTEPTVTLPSRLQLWAVCTLILFVQIIGSAHAAYKIQESGAVQRAMVTVAGVFAASAHAQSNPPAPADRNRSNTGSGATPPAPTDDRAKPGGTPSSPPQKPAAGQAPPRKGFFRTW